MEWCPQSRPWSRSVGPAMLRALLVLVLFFQPSSASHADEQHSYHTKIAFRNTKGHLVSESKEHNSYPVSLQSLLEYHFQLPKRRTEHILQDLTLPCNQDLLLNVSVCSREAQSSDCDPWAAGTHHSHHHGLFCALSLLVWQTGLGQHRGEVTALWELERSSWLSLPGKLSCKCQQRFVLRHCQSHPAHQKLHSELFLSALLSSHTSHKSFWNLQQGSSKKPKLGSQPLGGKDFTTGSKR